MLTTPSAIDRNEEDLNPDEYRSNLLENRREASSLPSHHRQTQPRVSVFLQHPKLSSMAADNNNKETEYGVLLYYKFTSIPDLDDLFAFYNSNCRSLSLLGRVRLSPNGVNVTVGGKLSSLEKHIAAVSSNTLFEGTDFKLASCHQPSDDKVAKECGFTKLSIRVVKELVTFSSHPLLKSPEVSNAGRHLSAAEFHSVLLHADARNLYETRIGKFQTPNVETLDPEIRQYSDLHSWIDNNSEQLRGSCVLMYCTGGIRCETASAYIRSKGDGFENVFQLFGGIQRYLEQFPDGGFFKGKNFVFDHRVSVGSSDANILGTCLLCSSPFDDYSSRSRCTHCRMLVLVCDCCQKKSTQYICELCQINGKPVDSIPLIENDEPPELSIPIEPEAVLTSDNAAFSPQIPWSNGISPLRKLRILCLHGFRQNSSSFRGRTASLAKKLKNVADLVFVNAPHELPFIYQPSLANPTYCASSSVPPSPPPPSRSCSKKFAWLTSPAFNGKSGADWEMADGPFDPLQYMQQTDGFDASLAYLKNVFSQAGPFDGMLGFSQGAAMAASVCSQQRVLKGQIEIRFVILCSGFDLKLSDHKQESIHCPSLHIFGNDQGNDRQISSQASRELASLFDDGCRVIIEHEFGHIIPTRSPYIDEIKDFLHRFLSG
ncbi:rhodanese-like domain-containing protein 6 isoform X3 [Actinidia eriantha]|uniref:rhodanese-like domain-containing protein 6 isoform X3 n=1 Tax=Actinidia eriantha TaxID=165200 RepID=UPI0025882F78|nr:rhodanese-like domain-containing protein 6 isoform X3 [Actinidia eriantha]